MVASSISEWKINYSQDRKELINLRIKHNLNLEWEYEHYSWFVRVLAENK